MAAIERRSSRRKLCDECAKRDVMERAQREEAEREKQRLAAAEQRWQKICPPGYQRSDLSRLPHKQFERVMGWQVGPRGLLLIGPTGGCKSRCAWLLVRRLLNDGANIEAFDCMSFAHAATRHFRSGTGEDWIERLCRTDIVFFDDLGKMPFTERVEAELFGLIEYRTSHDLPVIATMNMVGDDLVAKASRDRGEPMVRRLREFCEVVSFKPSAV